MIKVKISAQNKLTDFVLKSKIKVGNNHELLKTVLNNMT